VTRLARGEAEANTLSGSQKLRTLISRIEKKCPCALGRRSGKDKIILDKIREGKSTTWSKQCTPTEAAMVIAAVCEGERWEEV
jgi:hypothetical protein